MKHTLKALKILFALIAVFMLISAGIQIINTLNA